MRGGVRTDPAGVGHLAPPIGLWAPKRLRHFSVRMLAQQTDILDQTRIGADQALQVTAESGALPPSFDGNRDRGEAQEKPFPGRDLSRWEGR